ncbi:MAG: DUF4034 domain-containing protein [Nitrospirota bacterium]
MRIFIMWLGIVGFVLLNGCISPTAVAPAEELAKETIQELLKEEQFEKLDKIAEELRKSRKMLINGSSALSIFYNELTDNNGSEQEIVSLINLYEKWKKAYPDSPTPLVALSIIYTDYAYMARGSGWAGEVTDKQWELFYMRMNKADEYVNNTIAERDMRSYVEKIKIIKLIGKNNAKIRAYAILDKGIAIDPDYHSMYFTMAELFMERWHGDNRYEMIDFIDEYSARRKGLEGTILYIKMLLHMTFYYEPFNYLNRMNVSWSSLEQKLKSVLNEQPENIFILNAYWYFAGIALDLERAEELGRKLDKINGWLTDIWWDKDHKTSNKIKDLVNKRNQVAIFTLNIIDIWDYRGDLVAYYEFLDVDGNKIIGASGKKETISSSDINLKYSADKIVRYVRIPNNLLGDKIIVKYILENPTNGQKIETVKIFSFTGQALGEAKDAGFWNTNLLKNPSAENGVKNWKLWGEGGTIKTEAVDRGNVFYTMDTLDKKSHFYQDIILPLDAADAYMVVAGYLSADEVVADSIANRPLLQGYFMYQWNKIISNVSGKSIMYDCPAKYWQSRWGIFKIPAQADTVRLFIDHASVKGVIPNNSRFYYDDLELRVFKTFQEAEEFINEYKKQHPQELKD